VIETYLSVVPWLPIGDAALGAFFGAFFGFIVNQYAESLKKTRNRWEKHWNALVRLEYRLNEVMGLVADSKYMVDQLSESSGQANDATTVIWYELKMIPRDVPFSTDLLRIGLINLLFSFHEKLRKLNNDTIWINRSYAEMRSALLRRDVDRPQYEQSLAEFRSNLGKLSGAYGLLYDRTFALMVETRAAMVMDKCYNNKRLFRMPRPKEATETQRESARKQLAGEIKLVRSKSRSELEQYSL
jgi:hypothetical protein